MLMKFKKLPFSSGMKVASMASALSPTSARSATTRNRSKFMFAPEVTAITVRPFISVLASHCLAPAMERAPEGSMTERVSSNMSFRAAQISSFVTKTTSSTTSCATRNVSLPTIFTATPSANVSTCSSVTRSPSCKERNMASAPVGSTPMIRTPGRITFRYPPIPAMSPPPPTGTKTAARSTEELTCRSISMPMVPWPAMTRGWSKGGMYGMPFSALKLWAYSDASLNVSPISRTSAPRRRTASTLISGVTVGITMIALQPRCAALNATPCAWFPAEAVTMPLSSSDCGRFAMRLYAPRSLKLNTGCMSSRFTSTVFPTRSERRLIGLHGVSTQTSYTRALRTASRYEKGSPSESPTKFPGGAALKLPGRPLEEDWAWSEDRRGRTRVRASDWPTGTNAALGATKNIASNMEKFLAIMSVEPLLCAPCAKRGCA
mmetsp:Transcript_15590/g.20967  ORF Transcript_15590/g.20967 Transcript_15590/m.20967 type:complete len:434 (-) Transcript_15590:81-1382(-)